MTDLQMGANAPLPSTRFDVHVKRSTGHMDLIVLLLDAADKADGDDGVALFSNPTAGKGAVTVKPDETAGDRASVDLDALPAQVERLIFAAMADTPRGSFTETLTTRIGDITFTCPETSAAAVQVVELYKRNGAWKVRALGDGYAEGMAKLLSVHGIDVTDEPAAAATPPAPAAAPASGVDMAKKRIVDLTKKAEASGAGGVDLSKKIATAGVSLEKRGLLEQRAAVILVLDESWSSKPLFSSGAYQALCDRVFAAGLIFDDDGEIPTYLFASKAREADAVTLGNYAGWAGAQEKQWGGTQYAPPLELIEKLLRRGDTNPTFVAFITDGGNSDKGATNRIIQRLSGLPAFIQFIAVGRENDFPNLQRLDELSGREVDNAGFFAVEDPKGISDAQFFELMMSEFPDWLKAARSKGILG